MIAPLFYDTKSGAYYRRIIIAVCACITALAGLFVLPPIDRDEARFAQATAQMLESGDFVTIRFQDDERNKKPVGVHWLQAASVNFLSDAEARNIWAYRVPSVISVILAALLTLFIGEALLGTRVGFLAGLMMATTPIIAAEATFAKSDAALLASVLLAMACLVSIVTKRQSGTSAPGFASFGFWVAVGMGILLKGPIILIAVIPPLAFAQMRCAAFRVMQDLRPLLGVAIVIIMVAPWAVLIGLNTEGRFFSEAVGGDLLGKIGSVQERHWGPPGYHMVLAAALLWPATPFLAHGVWRGVKMRREWQFGLLLAWLVPGWILFEATATKLPHYPLPLYPPLAILAAAAAVSAKDTPFLLNRMGVILLGVIGLGMAVLISAGPISGTANYSTLQAVGLSLLFVAGVGGACLYYWRGRNVRGVCLASLMSMVFAWVLLQEIGPTLAPVNISTRLATVVKSAQLHEINDNAPAAILSGYSEPSAIFLLGTKTRLLPATAAAQAINAHHNGAHHDGAHHGDANQVGAIIIEAQQLDAFKEALSNDVQLRLIGQIDGINYSNGKMISLMVYTNE